MDDAESRGMYNAEEQGLFYRTHTSTYYTFTDWRGWTEAEQRSQRPDITLDLSAE